LSQRRDELVDAAEVEIAGRAGGEWHVTGRAGAAPGADLVQATRAGGQRPFVERHVGDASVAVEDVLRAVAVVGVVVDDQYARATIGERGRSNGDVVEETEAHGALRQRMMTRRPESEEGGAPARALERVHGGQAGARRPDPR